jgi:hypothetical protein
MTYIPEYNTDRTKVIGYRIVCQPEEYGRGSFRSYYADQSGVIRGTGRNRAATASDPEISHSEDKRFRTTQSASCKELWRGKER